jgi:Phosphatidylserine decarboxylase
MDSPDSVKVRKTFHASFCTVSNARGNLYTHGHLLILQRAALRPPKSPRLSAPAGQQSADPVHWLLGAEHPHVPEVLQRGGGCQRGTGAAGELQVLQRGEHMSQPCVHCAAVCHTTFKYRLPAQPQHSTPQSHQSSCVQFFYRKLKPEARPIAQPQDADVVVSAADCRLSAFPTVDDATRCWIKVWAALAPSCLTLTAAQLPCPMHADMNVSSPRHPLGAMQAGKPTDRVYVYPRAGSFRSRVCWQTAASV